MQARSLLIFAGGGTGGHLFPALAVVEQLATLAPDLAVEFLCTDREIDARILNARGVTFTTQPVLPLPRGPRAVLPFLRGWRRSTRMCRDRFATQRPGVVVGTGGFGSGPAVHVAHALGIPAALFNPDAVPGRANRHLARKVSIIFTQWQETADHFPAGTQVLATGCPVSSAFLDPAVAQPHARFGLDPNRRTLLVTGASSGAQTINGAMEILADELHRQAPDWQVLHVAGSAGQSGVEAGYRRAGVPACVVDFTQEMPAALRCADLALARAGAVTIAELRATATPAVLLPYPFHRDRHQQHNARAHAAGGGAVVLEDLKDPQQNAALLRQTLLPLMNDPQALQDMRRAAETMPGGRAAELICQQLLRIVRHAPP